MAWYNEVNQEAPEDDADDKEPEAASGKRDGFGSDGVVPPWVQAASLLAPTSEAAESSAPASPTPPVVAASAAPSATPTPPCDSTSPGTAETASGADAASSGYTTRDPPLGHAAA